MPSRFFALLLLGSLALAAGYAALVLGTASWEYARSLDELFPYYDWHIRNFSATDWHRAQQGLGGLAAGLAAGWVGLGVVTAAGRRELAAGLRAGQLMLRQVCRGWQVLPVQQRRWFWGLLGFLSLLRVYLSLTTDWADDAVSYEFFVRQRLLAVAAYYPLPNNHVLSNTLAWAFYQLHPGFWWAMRLPVLLTSTAGTVLLFGVLLRRLGYWPALLVTLATCLVQLNLYHAVVGRGYWLIISMTAVVFAALLVLLDQLAGPLRVRLAWIGLLGGALLGTYAVPTFVYVLGSAFSWLALQAAWRRQWQLLAQVGVVGVAAGLGIGLLYAPTLYVSGPAAMLANPYVQPLSAGRFWAALPAHAWFTEGYLLGQRHLGAVGTLLGLVLFGHLLWRWRAGQLAAHLARQVQAVGLPALWFVGFPYLLLLGQRVLPPERTWLYKSWFFFVLLALVLASWQPVRRGLLATGLGLFMLYQVGGQLRLNYLSQRINASHRAVFAWLQQHQGRGAVFIPDIYLWGWLRFETHIQKPGQVWQPDYQPRPGVAYAYAVTWRAAPHPAGKVVFTADQLLIIQVAPGATLLPLPR